MGDSVGFICPECGYSFGGDLGVGFLYPKLYLDTVQKMKAGDYGKEAEQFFIDYPDGVVDCENVLFQCDDCHKYYFDLKLSMYIPRDGVAMSAEPAGWSVEFPFKGVPYASIDDLEKHYELYAEYDHRCKSCGGKLSYVTNDLRCLLERKIACPICHAEMNK
ncbi:hypothetical protein FYJ51_13195 [Erysipelotrichaceae bacterium Oil+RF-744-GAM-WT-6]|uniref:Uncharacterized protein n=1 Tax=Stecheria intestinalis TaxID=2606630 RepID=A0A7X2NUQ1_9FIRM|nr:hypothetical protein [Stecheria intestinalis]MCI6745765.1 hypothetical protein [Anaerolactibacter massiliensis]MDY3235040.1 hypothetical protein [Erysipelotrichaceae bacterium]MSS59846.1 hypothetical protein [Stecheria intestinalis]